MMAYLGGILATVAPAMESAPQSPLAVPVWLEVAAMCTTGFFGAVLTANRAAPLLGILVGGLVVGLGGGIVRDMLLNLMPVAISEWYLIPAVGVASLAGGFCGKPLARSQLSIVFLQGVSLGLLIVIGSEKAAFYQVPTGAIIALGIVTAVAGGAILDALSGTRAALLSQGRWHLSSLFAGAIGFVILVHFTPLWLAEIATVTLVVILRMVSFKQGWNCPELPGSSNSSSAF